MLNVLNFLFLTALTDINPATGINLWVVIIPAGVALLVLIAMFIIGKKSKKK